MSVVSSGVTLSSWYTALNDSLHLAADNDAHQRLRSADALTFLVPATRCKTLGGRAFGG